MPELKASLDTIRRAASEMISAIDEKLEVLMAEKTQEQTVEVSDNVKNDTVDRKAELAELLKATAEKMSPEGKRTQNEMPKEKTTKKTSVKSKLQEGKEKAAKTPAKKPKKQEERA